jgi:flagellar biosynthesis protein FlhG
VLARLASVFAEQGLNTLVVDAADTAPEPGELSFIDLGACVEPLSPRLAYLAARGLPMQHVDTHGSCASFIPRMMNVVYDVDVVVLHAEARVLARMFGEHEVRPVLLASGSGDSLTHAYTALKLLVQRLHLMSFDLVMPTVPAKAKAKAPSPVQIAQRVADCADRFLGAALHDSAAIDPDMAFGVASGPDLMRLAAAQLSVTARPASTVPAASTAAAWTSARSRSAAPSAYLSA